MSVKVGRIRADLWGISPHALERFRDRFGLATDTEGRARALLARLSGWYVQEVSPAANLDHDIRILLACRELPGATFVVTLPMGLTVEKYAAPCVLVTVVWQQKPEQFTRRSGKRRAGRQGEGKPKSWGNRSRGSRLIRAYAKKENGGYEE